MRLKQQLLAFLFICFITIPVWGQEKSETTFPQLTIEEKLIRSNNNTTSYAILGLAFAKSVGKTPEEYGKFFSDTIVPFYERLRGQPEGFVLALNGVLQVYSDFKLEITGKTETSIRGRMTLPGKNSVELMNLRGVTVDDYQRFFNTNNKCLADALDMKYTFEFDGQWITFTVNMKK
jgi:hypothetical protein